LQAVIQLLEAKIDHIELDVGMKDEGHDVSHCAFAMARMLLGSRSLAFPAL